MENKQQTQRTTRLRMRLKTVPLEFKKNIFERCYSLPLKRYRSFRIFDSGIPLIFFCFVIKSKSFRQSNFQWQELILKGTNYRLGNITNFPYLFTWTRQDKNIRMRTHANASALDFLTRSKKSEKFSNC